MAGGDWVTGASPRRSWALVAALPESEGAAGLPTPTRGSGTADWTVEELASVQAALLAEVDRLNGDLDAARADIAGLIADSGDGAGDDQADAGSKTLERENEMSVSANTRDMLEQATRALKRLADGSYGLCESCGSPIRKGRLLAFPRATLCIDCKQREERR